MSATQGAMEQYTAQLDADYLSEARDTVASLEVLASNIRGGTDTSDDIARFHSEVAELRQCGHWADLPMFDLAVRRLEYYVTDLADPTERQVDDIEAYVDVLRGLVDGEIGKADMNEAEFVRSLPARLTVDISEIAHPNIEFLVVDPQRATVRIVERELHNCGYRVAATTAALEAIELAVRTRPDLVISSVVLDTISGVDLACALGAMPSTKNIPVALLTSIARDHESLSTHVYQEDTKVFCRPWTVRTTLRISYLPTIKTIKPRRHIWLGTVTISTLLQFELHDSLNRTHTSGSRTSTTRS